jgi:hypothetical protein
MLSKACTNVRAEREHRRNDRVEVAEARKVLAATGRDVLLGLVLSITFIVHHACTNQLRIAACFGGSLSAPVTCFGVYAVIYHGSAPALSASRLHTIACSQYREAYVTPCYL